MTTLTAPLAQRAMKAASLAPASANVAKTESVLLFAPPAVAFDFLSVPVYPKLMIDAVDDPLEHEADDIADRVMRLPDPEAIDDDDDEREQEQTGAHATIQRKCETCEGEDEQEAATGGVIRR